MTLDDDDNLFMDRSISPLKGNFLSKDASMPNVHMVTTLNVIVLAFIDALDFFEYT